MLWIRPLDNRGSQWGSLCKATVFMSNGDSEVAADQPNQQSGSKAGPEVEGHEDKLELS